MQVRMQLNSAVPKCVRPLSFLPEFLCFAKLLQRFPCRFKQGVVDYFGLMYRQKLILSGKVKPHENRVRAKFNVLMFQRSLSVIISVIFEQMSSIV
jgi:hypothetical protein